MTEQAQDVKEGFLWKQEHLAPLPIPTGQPASDLMNIIWRKNDVFMDIGSFTMGAGWMVLHMGTVLCLVSSAWTVASGDIWFGLITLAVMGGGLMGSLWYSFIKQWRKPLIPPIRFNRQRREVCITKPDGDYWFVPWERVHAIAPSALSLSPAGASKEGSLMLWLPLKGQEYEDYSPDKTGWVLMVNTGGGRAPMAQWECIRSFMEVGPEVVPDSSIPETSEKIEREGYWGAWKSYVVQLFDEIKAKEIGSALTTLCGLTIFGIPWVVILLGKKLEHIPDLTAPDAIEWSKPLPPEQWAKRSPELESAIAEQDAALKAGMATVTADAT